jgi:hypothetical protein
VAWGESARIDDAAQTRFVAVSLDGATWRLGTLPEALSDSAIVSADEGPSGWLLVASNDTNSATAGVWRSGDGSQWESVNASFPAGLVAQSVFGWTNGYVLQMRDDRTGTSRAALFTSRDGQEWREAEVPDVYQIAAIEVDGGLLIWAEQPDAPAWIRYAAVSSPWLDPSRGGRYPAPTGSAPMIAAAHRRFVALTTEQPSGPLRVWTATLSTSSDPAGPVLEWSRQPTAEARLAGAAIGNLVAVGDRFLAFGITYGSGEPVTWSTVDGVTWERLTSAGPNPAAAPGPIAVADAGLVGVGADLTAAGNNPRFWHTTDGATWHGEATSVLPPIDHALVGACPEYPSSMLDWMSLPGPVGAECFGEQPIAFRAWRTVGGGCGGFAPGIFEPAWLASPFAAGALILSPDQVDYGSCGSAAVHPDAGALPSPQQWVQVTGHWADPTSVTCRHLPDPQYPGFYGGEPMVFACRTTFVATEVVPES